MAPGVAVVIPAFNHARHLPEAIESVLAQDYPAIDLVVIDDGSTDDTKAVLERYRNRVRCYSRDNQGQSATLNEGWSATRGDILLYVGADDVLVPGSVQAAVAAFEAAPSCVGVYGDYLLIDEDSRTLRRVEPPLLNLRTLLHEFASLTAGAYFRRSVWEKVGGWDASFSQVPDRDFLQRVLLRGDLVRIDTVLAAFRVHPQSQTFRPRSAVLAAEPIQVTDRFFARQDLPDDVRALERRAKAMARVVVARHDLRRREWSAAGRQLLDAIGIDPKIVLASRAWRFVANGLKA